jgi:hypothetical protein
MEPWYERDQHISVEIMILVFVENVALHNSGAYLKSVRRLNMIRVEPPVVAVYQFLLSDLEISIVCLFVFVAWSVGSFGTCGSNKVSFFLCQEYNKLVERAVLQGELSFP